MKAHKNLPIYLLSAALLFVGVTSMSPAQGATSTTAQIASLQNRVKALEGRLKSLPTHQTLDISFVTAVRFSYPNCPTSYFGNELNLPSDNSYRFALCQITVLVP